MKKILDLPVPPFSAADNPPALVGANATVFLPNGSRLEGKLDEFDGDKGTITLIEANGDNKRLTLVEIKALQLNEPLQWMRDTTLDEANRASMKMPADTQEFVITFKDRSVLRGKTYGSRVEKFGIHLFKQHTANQYLRQYLHIFIPKTAIESNLIGDQLGEILSRDQKVPPQEIETALREQKENRGKQIGDFFVSKKIINSEQLVQALSRQKSMPQLKLGEILIGEALITEAQLQEALIDQKKSRRMPLGELLVQKKLVTREQIQQALAKKLGIPFVNIQDFQVVPETIRVIPASLAFKHKVVPLYQYEGKIAIAIENPMDWEALDALKFHTNKYIEPVMATAEDINWALQFYYSSDDVLTSIDQLADQQVDDDNFLEESILNAKEDAEVSDNIVVKMINKIILDAYQKGASDIHIEPYPGKQKTVVRFRKDGEMLKYHDFPHQYRNALTSRVKVMARLDISEKRKPQDGKINFKQFGPANIELRVATLPTSNDLEDVVMRILSSGRSLPINALGLETHNRDRLLEAIAQPYGLFLVCGPTGSGKTTTLHSILAHLNDEYTKIWTAEDPVEITQTGLRQLQVNPKVGLTFAAAMRSFLRADPDIIMIGEMRDPEAASVCIEASLTGHLVLSTLHTNSAAESIIRLLDMGMDPFNFADALLGILSQRLARTLCPSCKKSYTPHDEELNHLAHEYCGELVGYTASAEELQTAVNNKIAEWRGKFTGKDGQISLFKPMGCSECNETGYRGRIGLHELLVATPEIKHLILERTLITEIQRTAIKNGLRTLKQDGIEKVLLGYTDFPQIRAVCIR